MVLGHCTHIMNQYSAYGDYVGDKWKVKLLLLCSRI